MDVNDDLREKLLNNAFHFISIHPRSISETKKHLLEKTTKWQIKNDQIVDVVIQRLIEMDYLNDTKFTEWWIDQRQRQLKGWNIIKYELHQKGINLKDRPDINIERKTEMDTALNAVSKKLPLWKNLPSMELKQKLYNYLFRRGFNSEVIVSAIDASLKKD
jgi:regulatory protein